MSNPNFKINPPVLPVSSKLKKATNIQLAQRFSDKDKQGKPLIEAGSLWTLSLPEMGSKDKLGHLVYAVHEVAHKEGRPYLVLSSKEHNNLSGLVCVAPLTTFTGRYLIHLPFTRVFVLRYGQPLTEHTKNLSKTTMVTNSVLSI